MILYILISFSLGIEGGYSLPANGFRDIDGGVSWAVNLKRVDGFIAYGINLNTVYNRGKNLGYTLNKTDLKFLLYHNKWRISPVLELGFSYIKRSLSGHKEVGYGFQYGAGFLIKFNFESVRIIPGFYYEGITDFKAQGGFIEFRLGIDYEI